jgi:D-serine dehydratase
MLNLNSLDQQYLAPGTKGLALTKAIQQQDIGKQNWNILNGDTSFPVAVLKQTALQHNLRWMKQFCETMHIVLAPHGKTTMSPQIFDMQLENGAWGMTLATVNQCLIAYRFGVKRILLANQLISRSDTQVIFDLMKTDADFEFFALTDSLEGVAHMAAQVQASGLQRPFPLLVELGFTGGRTGCRTFIDALEVARAIRQNPYLQLAGFEGYEGLMVSNNRRQDLNDVETFVNKLVALARLASIDELFEGKNIILSAGGSAYFDLVGRSFERELKLSRPVIAILRSGCYVTHDHGFYNQLLIEMQKRESTVKDDNLRPALEIWSMVQSRPEPDLAILTMGKRDASYDIDLPFPLQTHRPGNKTAPINLPAGCKIEKMNDQHAYLRLPKDSTLCKTLRIGDLIACGISHPCTTFDKWPVILVVDDQYQVQSAINTFF